jgi:hypothetical protein
LQNNGELIYIKPEDEILHQVYLHQALLPQYFQLLHRKKPTFWELMQVLYTIGVRLIHLWNDEIFNFVCLNDNFL